MSERWVRLENYAKWRQNQLPMCNLPADILTKICKYLDIGSACDFIDAITGTRVTPRVATHIRLVQKELLPFWVICHTRKEIENFINSISSHSFYMATQCTMVRMFIDWSPFKSKIPPIAVAEFKWLGPGRGMMNAHTRINYEEVLRCIYRAYRKRRPMGYVTLHRCYEFYDKNHMDMRPAFTTSVSLIPNGVVPLCAKLTHAELRHTRYQE